MTEVAKTKHLPNTTCIENTIMFSSQRLFQLTAIATTAFVMTIFAMAAMLAGDPDAPVNLWFNLHGARLLIIEVIAIGVSALGAMFADRNETLREQIRSSDPEKTTPPASHRPVDDSSRQ